MRKFTMTALILSGALGGALQPAALPAAQAEACGQALWDDYNECLMSTTNFFIRSMCDLDFMLTWYACRKAGA